MNRLHHIALGAHDPERVAAFYRDLLGLRELKRHAWPDGSLRSIWLDLGGSILMIEATREPARFIRGVGAGPFLIAFGAGSEERAGLERSLSAAGFPIESRTEHTIYLRDPEGNRVAVSSLPWSWPT